MKRDMVKNSDVLSDIECRNYQFFLARIPSICKYYSEVGETIRFSFTEGDSEFDQEEKPFIREILMELLSRKCCVARIVDSKTEYFPHEGVYINSKKVVCGNIAIDIVPTNGKLIEYVDEVVNEYNKEITRPKVYRYERGNKNGKFNNGKTS